MSFQFRRRVDVREQSPHQEPFFQSPASQQAFNDHMPMEQHTQGYDARMNMGYGQLSQPQFPQGNQGSFYGPQRPMMNHPQNHHFGQTPPLNQYPDGMPQESFYPKLNAQRSGPQLNNFQAAGFQPNGFQGFSPFGQATQPHPDIPFIPEETKQERAKPNHPAFWHEKHQTASFDDNEEATSTSPVKLLVAIAGVALIGALSWFAYKWAKAPSVDTPPIIHAEPGPHKVSPDHRGGINIPYQDKLIYNRIGGGSEPAEKLLPMPEQPQPEAMYDQEQYAEDQAPMYPEAPQAPDRTHPNHQQGYYNQPYPNAPHGQTAQTLPIPQAQPQAAAVPQQLKAEKPAAVKKKKETEEDEDEAEATPTKAKPEESLGGKFFVQLATVKSEGMALKEWTRLRSKHNLKDMKSQIKESERPDGEVVYRLLMGPFTEKVKALKYAVKIDGAKVVHVTD